LDVIYCEEKKN